MKDDERQLLQKLQAQTNPPNFPYVREMVHDLGIPEKRAAYILEKWAQKGWYEYGVSVLAGWLTKAGRST